MMHFTLGSDVVNRVGDHDILAQVVGFHPSTGDPILYVAGYGRWVANAEFCVTLEQWLAEHTGKAFA